jgi:uncharacterized coiled-coil protein SlyX
MQDRIVALEERMMFLERHVEELDGVVRDLHKRFDVLREDFEHLDRLVRLAREASDEDGEPAP